MLTQKELMSVLRYEPSTGEFTWLVDRRRTKAGDPAGSINNAGYHRIKIDQTEYLAHRLAWLYMTGKWPDAFIDHINRDRLDNKWSNLREARPCENLWNSGLSRHNTSGIKGVAYMKKSNKWRAHASAFGRSHHIGLFDTIEEAASAVSEFRKVHHGQYARDAASASQQ